MTLGKSFINEVTSPVQRSLRSCILSDPDLRLIPSEKVLYRRQASECNDKVILVSGGGSGHEPAHAGYLGQGALDVVVAGEIFASPSASQILTAIRAVNSPKGSLLIVKNYTGDKLNFGLAAEMAEAHGLRVNMVVVGDDVSVQGNSLVGQRGLAGVVLVHKIAGAKAAEGSTLDQVTVVANKAAQRIATVAASLDRCSIPGRVNQVGLPEDLLELGMGIHNEPGVRREKIHALETTVKKMLDIMFTTKEGIWHPAPGQNVALMINNLGGLSVLELGVIADEAVRQVVSRDINIVRNLVGTFVTSLDGPGFSVSLLHLDEELQQLLDAPTTAPAWPRSTHGWSTDAESISKRQIERSRMTESSHQENTPKIPTSLVQRIIDSVVDTTTTDEPKITEYDTLAGDGDCGETLLRGVRGLKSEFQDEEAEYLCLDAVFRRVAAAAESYMGGTSGAIYAIFFNAVANQLRAKGSGSLKSSVPDLIGKALQGGLESICRYTPARIGHRTLMDALIPFVNEYGQGSSIETAVIEARKGAEGTREMAAALGRASYVDQARFDEEGGIPDPGAMGVISILRGIETALQSF